MADTVYISSTYLDLIHYRQAVADLIQRAGLQTIRMETMSARGEEPTEACIQDVAEAEFFVGIYAWKYGTRPSGTLSITESELLAAETMDRTILCFEAHESTASSWPPEHVEGGEGKRRLVALKERLRHDHKVETFTDPSDLAGKVVAALTHYVRRREAVTPERRELLALWKRVQHDWLKGVLLPSVPEGRRLEIGREERPRTVSRGARSVKRMPATSLPPLAEPLHSFFDRHGCSLLILGASGAGKTIALLELARHLGRLARASAKEPVPVVFNLASWRGRPSRLTDWMADEFWNQYRINREQAADWIRRNDILPLLDGLDEVEPDCRADCADAINAYLEEPGVNARMAVCCRTDVYDIEKPLLSLRSAVVLLPLTQPQVDEHLARGGAELSGLRAAIAGSAELRELTASPLFLNLVEGICRGARPEEIRVRGAEDVLTEYVTQRLKPEPPVLFRMPKKRRPSARWWLPWRHLRALRPESAPFQPRRYPAQAARRTLAWLARRMAEHNPSLFRMERLQPSWLDNRRQIWGYALTSRTIGGVLIALPLTWLYRSVELGEALSMGVVAGMFAGALDASALQRPARPVMSERKGKRHLIRRILLVGIPTALLMLPIRVLLAGLLVEEIPTHVDAAAVLRNLLKVTTLFAAVVGIVLGSRGASRDPRHDVRAAEKVVWKWSWRGARLGALGGCVLGATFSMIARFAPKLSSVRVGTWLLLIALLAALGGLLSGAVGGARRRLLERKVWPNEGTWRGLLSTLKMSFYVGAGMTLTIAALFIPRRRTGIDWQGFSDALSIGLAVALWVGLWFGGLDFIQHFTLRTILRLRGRLPAGPVQFLDYATDRELLQRVGGSYKFYHPLLLQHLVRSGPARRVD